MKYWKKPKDEHIVYEAVTAILDCRVEKVGDSEYRIYSSSRNKFYTVSFVLENSWVKIMSDDNMAYFRKEVSYPMLIVLLREKIVDVNLHILVVLKGILWKDINQKNKNDYIKSVEEVLKSLQERKENIEQIKEEVAKVWKQLSEIKIEILGEFKLPSKSY
jgi:predicted DNA-binding transcriptional regulator